MKLVLLLVLLVGCGSETGFVVYPIHGVDGKDAESIVGPAGQDGKDADETRLTLLEERVTLLEAKVAVNSQDIADISSYLDSLLIDIKLQEISEKLLNIENNLTSISVNFTAITNSLQSQINALKGKMFEIVKPCSNSKEVLVKTDQGYLAYFQVGANKNYTFQVNETIPTHVICEESAGNSGICKKFTVVNSTVATKTVTLSIFELKHAYLSLLSEGVTYKTTDGMNCTFTIENGELQ